MEGDKPQFKSENPEVQKTKLVTQAKEREHIFKMEREDQRHMNIMTEIQECRKAGIKVFVRGFATMLAPKGTEIKEESPDTPEE